MAVIGIDLGTTNSLACVCQDGRAVLIPNSLGENLTPSVVSVGENGEICVGAVAKERLISHPEASASSFKRYMGTNKVFTLAGNNFTPQELSSFVLRQLKEDAERYLGEEVTEAVISVPAYFNDNQRYATREAGRLAGIHVERLVNEPSAAALTTSRISGEEEGSYLVFDFSPDEVVAMGVGIYAGIKERKQDIRDLVLTDICPFTLGVNVVNYVDDDNPIMSAVIERNSVLPCSRTDWYTNACDNQMKIVVGIYQGEAFYCNDNLKLGAIEMDIAPVRKGRTRLKVCFTYDINGILEVEVTDCTNPGVERAKRKVLTSENLRLSDEEIERRLKELRTYKLMPHGGIRAKMVMARGERLYAQTLGARRQEVAAMLGQIQQAVASGDDRRLNECLRMAEELFGHLDT